jgi:ribulose 1,5-bisphosphate synthetase/thiazole synthase
MAEIDAEAIIVGAGPTGLTRAGELALAGIRALVLETRVGIGEVRRPT